MNTSTETRPPDVREAPINMSAEEFRKIGHNLVDEIAVLLEFLDREQLPVTPKNQSPKDVRALLQSSTLPRSGESAQKLVSEVSRMLLDHSLYNGHPRFLGYITSSPAPMGILADLLASAVNPNVGAWILSPAATEIELQTIRWICQMIGFPETAGGILVDGGNMANFVCFLAARKAVLPWDVRKKGMFESEKKVRIYTSAETHTWIQKAADIFGLGTDAIRWIPTDDQFRMDVKELEKEINDDLKAGDLPFMVIGTAGSTGSGAIDPLGQISKICDAYDLWFHVDGAYGGFAVLAENAPSDLQFMREADSVAVDPHKWLYAPLEAGCSLVKNPNHLREAFSYHPSYYRFDSEPGDVALNSYDYGPQNSRGFRALKVWMGIRQVGSEGHSKMISQDINLAQRLYRNAASNPLLEAVTCGLSVVTFRFIPEDLRSSVGSSETEEYLNRLNEEILAQLQRGGEVFLSNAVLKGRFVLRGCIVNFRTSEKDVEEIPLIVARVGKRVDAELRGKESA